MTSRSIYFMQKNLNMIVYTKMYTLPMLNNAEKHNILMQQLSSKIKNIKTEPRPADKNQKQNTYFPITQC